MGLFKEEKTKDGKDAPVPKDSLSAAVKSEGSAEIVKKEPLLKDWIRTARDTVREWKSQSCELLNSPEIKEVQRMRRQFANQFCHPLADIYRSFPEEMTSFKFAAFGQYNYRERLFGLEGLVLLTAISTLRVRSNNLGFANRFMLSIRNSSVVFLLGGLFIAPEIYNPLIKSDF